MNLLFWWSAYQWNLVQLCCSQHTTSRAACQTVYRTVLHCHFGSDFASDSVTAFFASLPELLIRLQDSVHYLVEPEDATVEQCVLPCCVICSL
jgi:hypothetical protein